MKTVTANGGCSNSGCKPRSYLFFKRRNPAVNRVKNSSTIYQIGSVSMSLNLYSQPSKLKTFNSFFNTCAGNYEDLLTNQNICFNTVAVLNVKNGAHCAEFHLVEPTLSMDLDLTKQFTVSKVIGAGIFCL